MKCTHNAFLEEEEEQRGRQSVQKTKSQISEDFNSET